MQWMTPILITSKAGITMKLNKAQLIQKANENHFKITRERTIYFKETFNSITGNHLDNDARDFTNGFTGIIAIVAASKGQVLSIASNVQIQII